MPEKTKKTVFFAKREKKVEKWFLHHKKRSKKKELNIIKFCINKRYEIFYKIQIKHNCEEKIGTINWKLAVF